MMSSIIMMPHPRLKFQWNQSRYNLLAPMTRHVLLFLNNRLKRRMYSKMLIPPNAAVTMEKTILGVRFVPYQRPKYRPIGMKTQSMMMRAQKKTMLHLRFQRL